MNLKLFHLLTKGVITVWIVCGRLEQPKLIDPWVILDWDKETGDPIRPMTFEDVDKARDKLDEHRLVQQSKRSANPVWCLNLITGEVVEL